jgi:nicotinamidase-related amidase
VIYVNDATGTWEADRTKLLQRCLAPAARGRDVVRQIAPADGDVFIFKPRHSAFYATPLAEMLGRMRVEELILTGITSHQCVLFSAMDAHVRNLELTVPQDCIGAPTARQTRQALFVLREALQARIVPSPRLRLR